MTLPVEVIVSGTSFPVKAVPGLKGVDGDIQYGSVEFDPHLIRINSDFPAPVQQQTLLHEILPAAIRLGSLSEVIEASNVPGLEEALVVNLDHALASAKVRRTARSKVTPLLFQ